jgi:hypothetical protein
MIVNECLQILKDYVPSYVFDPVWERYKDTMLVFPAAVKHHHANKGGYINHVAEVVSISQSLYEFVSSMKPLDFNIESLLKVAFLHDLDKLERYEIDPEPPTPAQAKYARSLGIVASNGESKTSISTKIDNAKNNKNAPVRYFAYKKDVPPADESARVMRICLELGIPITDAEVSAISCHHGGWSAAGSIGQITQMSAMLHSADLMSAKILGV